MAIHCTNLPHPQQTEAGVLCLLPLKKLCQRTYCSLLRVPALRRDTAKFWVMKKEDIYLKFLSAIKNTGSLLTHSLETGMQELKAVSQDLYAMLAPQRHHGKINPLPHPILVLQRQGRGLSHFPLDRSATCHHCSHVL